MTDFAELDGLIWMDGELVPWREAKVHVFTHTLHYGLGFFEGIRAYMTKKGTVIFRLKAHVERFFDNAKMIGMPLPITKEDFHEAILTVLRKNSLSAAYIRPLAYLGTEKWGITIDGLSWHIAIAALPWEGYRGHDQFMQQGLSVKTSSIQRNHVNSMLSKAKICGHYVNSLIATQEAHLSGYNDALMLDHQGFVAEAGGANVFIVKDGKVYTPQVDSIFPGITRASVIQMLQDLKIPVLECNIVREQIYTADEAFFTGTAYEIIPMGSLDKRQVGDKAPGPVTEQLQSLFSEITQGRNKHYKEWLTYL